MCFLAVLIVLKELGLSSDSLFLCDETSRRGGSVQELPLPPSTYAP